MSNLIEIFREKKNVFFSLVCNLANKQTIESTKTIILRSVGTECYIQTLESILRDRTRHYSLVKDYFEHHNYIDLVRQSSQLTIVLLAMADTFLSTNSTLYPLLDKIRIQLTRRPIAPIRPFSIHCGGEKKINLLIEEMERFYRIDKAIIEL